MDEKARFWPGVRMLVKGPGERRASSTRQDDGNARFEPTRRDHPHAHNGAEYANDGGNGPVTLVDVVAALPELRPVGSEVVGEEDGVEGISEPKVSRSIL